MIVSILAIAAFQYYWLGKAYEREERGLERQTNMLFRETVGNLQAAKFKLDKIADTTRRRILIKGDFNDRNVKIRSIDPKMVNIINMMTQRAKDSGQNILITSGSLDSLTPEQKAMAKRKERIMQFLFDIDSLQDSIRVSELHLAFQKRLDEQNIDVPFIIGRVLARRNQEPVFNEVTLGVQNPITYRLDLFDTKWFLLKRISTPILFSIFLVGFTFLSFSLLYRNLLKQKRLGDIKNEFISNITHELKTPIATVSVAIEALRSFNANMDQQRTKEYLDISANELQRLSLLVDKVLKLSMFEKKEIDLKYENLNMKELVDEVTSSMRLQFEKHHAEVRTVATDDNTIKGDRLHLESVIFNLLDNALKYSKDKPTIDINISTQTNRLILKITDSGIGIPSEYLNKIFEKFFRVPTGNLHNAKGYGLGLSYVAHVVKRHHGTINAESNEGHGSSFIITLPRNPA